jgi:hypothetical protein
MEIGKNGQLSKYGKNTRDSYDFYDFNQKKGVTVPIPG